MPRRNRRRAWGSIDSVIPNKKYVLRWMENTPEGRRRRCETFYGTYREADLRLAQIRVEHKDDKPVPTIGEAYKTWYLPSAEARRDAGKLASTSFKQYTRVWASVIAPRWSDVPLDSVRPIDVQNWLSEQTHSNAVVSLTLLRQIAAFAERYEVADNKFAKPYVMPEKTKKRRRGVLTLEDANKMLKKLHGARCEAAFILSCFGSCRTGESLGTRVDEIGSFEVGGLTFATVPIVRMMELKGDFPVERLKTPESNRVVCVPPPYSARLLEISEERKRARIDWFAARRDGMPLKHSALREAWIKESGDPIPFQNLRNSWRTFAQLEWGVSADTLELLMGHKLPGTTGAHYMRPTGDVLARRFAEEFADHYEALRKS